MKVHVIVVCTSRKGVQLMYDCHQTRMNVVKASIIYSMRVYLKKISNSCGAINININHFQFHLGHMTFVCFTVQLLHHGFLGIKCHACNTEISH